MALRKAVTLIEKAFADWLAHLQPRGFRALRAPHSSYYITGTVVSTTIASFFVLSAVTQGVPAEANYSGATLRACSSATAPVSRGTRTILSPWSASGREREVFPPATQMSWSIEGYPEISQMSTTIASVLEFNAVRFPGARGDYYSFLPGKLYEQIYFRDLFTTSKTSQYLYGDAFLQSALDEVFAQQLTSASKGIGTGEYAFPGPGSLNGLLSGDGTGKKTTATSDEETSIIQLAHLYYSVAGGLEWLGCTVAGVTVLQRLNQAMERLLLGRQEPNTGLLKRAHTTDWGDVRFQGGETPTQAAEYGEYWTASIFDQAWAYMALRDLAEMNATAGNKATAQKWLDQASQLKQATQRFLWQPSRGFYRIHMHLTPQAHDFDEDAMVAIGNAAAVYAGLADNDQTARIFDALERARVQAGSSKPGVALFPAYPQGFFNHPQMFPGQYQNGGLWDWWGGLQMTAEFTTGFSQLAFQHLSAVARDWSRYPDNIVEWQSLPALGFHGSDQYAGTGGMVGEAVVQGLFGAQLQLSGFVLQPRLGNKEGHLQITQPASGYNLWMRQRVSGNTLWLQYSTNHDKSGLLSIMLPPGSQATALQMDGLQYRPELKTVGNDLYLDVGEVPSGTHEVAVELAPVGVQTFSALWKGHTVPQVLPAQQRTTVMLDVENIGAIPWTKEGIHPIRASYQWFDAQGHRVPLTLAPEAHTDLPRDVAPGESVKIPLLLLTPSQSGMYRLKVDLLQEGVVWFNQARKDNLSLEMGVHLSNQPWAAAWLDVPVSLKVDAGVTWAVKLGFENKGLQQWQPTGKEQVQVEVRWYRELQTPISAAAIDNNPSMNDQLPLNVQKTSDEEVTSLQTIIVLPKVVLPGEVASLYEKLQTPNTPGTYRAQFSVQRRQALNGSYVTLPDGVNEVTIVVPAKPPQRTPQPAFPQTGRGLTLP